MGLFKLLWEVVVIYFIKLLKCFIEVEVGSSGGYIVRKKVGIVFFVRWG